jgi:hypothetical protein
MSLLNKTEYLYAKKGDKTTLAIPRRRASSVALVLFVINVQQTIEIN